MRIFARPTELELYLVDRLPIPVLSSVCHEQHGTQIR